MTVSHNQTREFLEVICSYGLRSLTLVSFGIDSKLPLGQWFDLSQATEIDRAVEWAITQNSQKRGVYWCVAPTKHGTIKKPKKSDLLGSVLCHIDIDPDASSQSDYELRRDAVLAKIHAINLEPTLVIDSGHGAYPIWILSEPASIKVVEELNKSLMMRFDRYAGTWNADRILRLPGTLNWPTKRKVVDYGYPEEPAECTLIAHTGVIYNLSQIEEYLLSLQDFGVNSQDKHQRVGDEIEDFQRTYQMVLDRNANDQSSADFAVMASCYERGLGYEQAADVLRLIAPRDKLYREDYLPRTWEAVVARAREYRLRLPDIGEDLATDAVIANPTQDRVARLIENLHATDLMHVTGIGWYHWSKKSWKPDETGLIVEFVRRMARSVNPRSKPAISSYNFADGVRKFLQSSPVFNVPVSELDADHYLLGTSAGIVDLRSGLIREARPEDRITHSTRVAPADNWREANHFLGFLDSVTCGDAELAIYLQKSLGATLCGAVEDHWLLFWMGPGRNGKNTLGDLVLWIMGDYGVVLPSEVLMQQKNEMHSTDLVRLRGARLAVSSEVSEGAFWHESKIKSLTGDSVIAARLMHKDGITFARSHKHLIYGNHRPQIRSVDRAIQARVHIVPFMADYSPESGNCDPEMPAKLKLEAPYILRWLIEGCLLWQADNKVLKKCLAVQQETDSYFEEQATIDLWIEEHLDPDPGDLDRPIHLWSQAAHLYQDYKSWKENRGEYPKGQTSWGNEMSSRFTKKKHNTGFRYIGATLKAPDCI